MKDQEFLLSTDQKAFLDGFATIIHKKYYYVPFWFEKLENGNWKIHKLGELPEKIKTVIGEIREGNKQNSLSKESVTDSISNISKAVRQKCEISCNPAIKFARWMLKYCVSKFDKEGMLVWMYEGVEYDSDTLYKEFLKSIA